MMGMCKVNGTQSKGARTMAHAINFIHRQHYGLSDRYSFDEIRGVVYSIGLSLAFVWLPIMWVIVHYGG
jgi:hypothetical protein